MKLKQRLTALTKTRGVTPRRLPFEEGRGVGGARLLGRHRLLDPGDFRLEHFDPLGRWRTEDGGEPVDSSGAMVDGTAFNGSVELRRALLERSDAFRTTLTERLLAYAVKGQPDMPTVRAVLRDAESENYLWSALIAGIVTK